MKKLWKVNPADTRLQEVLSRELNILPLTAQLLINRGIVESDKAFSFLRPHLTDLYDPFCMKDMEKAVDRLIMALKARERIAIYGDYDVDGTTATAMLYLFFRELGASVSYYIPDRLREGYGLNEPAIEGLWRDGVRVIITVDCGISDHREVRFAQAKGIDVIVTDHHEVPPELPCAFAILNPKQRGCAFPFKGLSGAGVAFNLAMALRAGLRRIGWFTRGEPNLKRYLDLVCIGTVADMVPLVDENRVLVSYGLRELERSNRPGIVSLKEVSGLGRGRVDTYNIAFQIAPRINAAGRLKKALKALRLLITDNKEEAELLAKELDSDNSTRQAIEERIFREAIQMVKEEDRAQKGVVLFSEGWHPGVIGIVASRMVEHLSRPCVLIAIDGDTAKGSVRGVRNFNVIEGLRACDEYLSRYGGHYSAAGLTLAVERLEGFKDAFIRYANTTLTDRDLMPEIVLDAIVSLDELSPRMVSEIEMLSPFGCANEEPVLGLRDAHILNTEIVGQRHLRLVVKHNGCAKSGIGFGLADLHPVRGEFNIAFYPYMDDWQGMKNLRLKIRDIQPSGFVNS